MIHKEAGTIDWEQDDVTIDRLIRAMTPWPGAHTWWNGEPFKIARARPADGALPDGPPGLVTRTGGDIVVLAAGGGLALEAVQPPGKRAMPAEDFARGHPAWIGSVLGQATPSES
jgi:methionyl-tRNA formyltransferase